jgi:hypothetical protein
LTEAKNGNSWRFQWIVGGALFGLIVTLVWGMGFIALKLLSYMNYNPEWLKADDNWLRVGLKQWQQWVAPFLPGAALAGAAAGYWARFRADNRLAVSLVAGVAPVVGYTATTTLLYVWTLFQPRGGYAAHQGMVVLLLLIGPFLGLTAAPAWVIIAYLLLRCRTRRQRNKT